MPCTIPFFLKQIDRIQRNFIWGTNSDLKKIHYISWYNITKPKEEGGLELITANNKNLISLSNLAWRLLTNQLPPGQVLSFINMPNANLQKTAPSFGKVF